MINKIEIITVSKQEELEFLIKSKLLPNTYYLINNMDFEKLEKGKNIRREIYTVARDLMKLTNDISYIIFETNLDIEKIYELVQIIRQTNDVIIAIANTRNKEITILFLNNNNDLLIIKKIKDFIDIETVY